MAINNVQGNTLLESGAFPPCRAATTAAITLSGLQTVDGVSLNAGDRVLVWHQLDATTNGIYAVSTGNWVRVTDAQTNTQFYNGMLVFVASGTINGGLLFQCTCTDDPVVIGTSLLTFSETHASPGAALTVASDTNIELALGGAPALALLEAASITAGWQGTLAVARGGTAAGAASGTALDNITGFSATGFLTRTGAGTYAFQSTANGITNANLAQAAAWTLKGNPTGAIANETDFTIPSLTLKSGPVSGDLVMIADSAASYGFKYSPISSIVSVGSTLPANPDNFLPNVNWQLWSALTYVGKQASSGVSSYPAIAFTDTGTATAQPVLTAVGGIVAPLQAGDIVVLSKGGTFNYWGYPGTAYANATIVGARITTTTTSTITLEAPLGGLAVSPNSAATWQVQGIGIGNTGSAQGPDGWTKTPSLQIWADDFATNFCPGAIRVLGMQKGVTGSEDIFWQCAPNQLRRFQGQTITFGVLIWQKVQGGSNTWQAYIHDNVTGPVFSTAGTGSGTGYQFLSVTATVSELCTSLQIGIQTEGNAGDIYYMALPTAVIGSTLTAGGCKQNLYDWISATAHWNPPILLGYQFNFPSALSLGLYSINEIDIEAISLCQCHKSVSSLVCKVEWLTSTVGAYVFSGNNVNVGGGSGSTQSLKFGPQTITCVSGVNNVGQGNLPLWFDGTFTLFTATAGGLVPGSNTWDFWDVIGSAPGSLN